MIGWILDLVFSNFWLFIILFWVIRTFSKGVKEGKGATPPRKKRVLPIPQQRSWEFDPPLPFPTEPIDRIPTESKQAEIKHEDKRKELKGRNEQNLEEQIELVSPVQGMIWSQIYGPPRSKQPHRSRRR